MKIAINMAKSDHIMELMKNLAGMKEGVTTYQGWLYATGVDAFTALFKSFGEDNPEAMAKVFAKSSLDPQWMQTCTEVDCGERDEYGVRADDESAEENCQSTINILPGEDG